MIESAQPGLLATLGINGKLFLAQLVNFALVVVVVWRWIYRPLLRVMDERAKKISTGLSDAERAKHQLEESDVRKKETMKLAQKEARAIIDEARSLAEQEKERILATSQKELDDQLQQVRARISHEKDAMMTVVRSELADLISLATEKVSSGAVDPRVHRALIDKAIQDLESSKKV